MTLSSLQTTFDAFERAAAEGTRAPFNNTEGVDGDAVSIIARSGEIRVLIYGKNYRVVEILIGPHAGKQTLLLPGSGRLQRIIDTKGSRFTNPHKKAVRPQSDALLHKLQTSIASPREVLG